MFSLQFLDLGMLPIRIYAIIYLKKFFPSADMVSSVWKQSLSTTRKDLIWRSVRLLMPSSHPPVCQHLKHTMKRKLQRSLLTVTSLDPERILRKYRVHVFSSFLIYIELEINSISISSCKPGFFHILLCVFLPILGIGLYLKFNLF